MSQFLLQVHRPYLLGLLSLLASFLVIFNIYKADVQQGRYKGNENIFFIFGQMAMR